jgi:hypothetical protein
VANSSSAFPRRDQRRLIPYLIDHNHNRKERTMISVRRILRSAAAAVLAAAVTTVVASAAAAAPAAFAIQVPPPGLGDPGTPVAPPPVHTVTVGGMPGWQITLIAVGAALLAAAITLLLDRMWTTRRRQLTTGVS